MQHPPLTEWNAGEFHVYIGHSGGYIAYVRMSDSLYVGTGSSPREAITDALTFERGVTDDAPLPYVSVYLNEELIGEFRGPNAKDAAEDLCGRLVSAVPGTEPDMSVSDTRCPSCGAEFWHEAVTPGKDGDWCCPSCDTPLPEQTGVST